MSDPCKDKYVADFLGSPKEFVDNFRYYRNFIDSFASLGIGKCPAFIRWYNNNRVASIYDLRKSISPVSLIVIAFEYAKIFLSLHFVHAKSMLTALNIRYFGTVIHKTHSWMTTYIAASPRFKNKFAEDLGKFGFNFDEMVD